MKPSSPAAVPRGRSRTQSPLPGNAAIVPHRTPQNRKPRSSLIKKLKALLSALFSRKSPPPSAEVNSGSDLTQSSSSAAAQHPLKRFSYSTDSTGSKLSNSKSSSTSRFSNSRDTSASSFIQIGSLQTTFNEICKATGNFSAASQIGEGAFGTVFRGKLKDGSIVAIKRAKQNSSSKDAYDNRTAEEFKNEVLTLSSIEHLNLVRYYGYLEHGNELIIIVEYVSNGTLRDHLDGLKGEGLQISERLDIAIDVAHAITYLHTYSDPPIIHRDIKATNILITEKFRAKVADFGFARVATEEDLGATHISTQVKGTAGYLDPEYLKTYQLTDKSDVYSFGVLLVEMVTARHPIEQGKSSDQKVTARWAMRKLKDREVVVVMDPRLKRSPASIEAVEKILKLARLCISPSRRSRPSMKKCAEILWEIRKDFNDKNVASAVSTSHNSDNVTAARGGRDESDLYRVTDSDYHRFISA